MAKDITVHFTKAPDYRLLPISGAWGGPSLVGDIVVDFFVEKITTPDQVVMRVEPTGAAEEVSRSEQKNIREIQVGLVLRPDIALSVGNWLVKQANQVLQKTNAPTAN